MSRIALQLFSLLSAISLSALSQVSPAPALHDRIDKVFARWDSTISPGCALAVMKDGKVVYRRGYGMADLDHDIPINPQTVFHVASISKQFTAAAVILLAQQGKLSLDDDVRKYIPELPDFGSVITIRHLIHHTSGLRDQWELLGLAGWRYSLDLITDDDVLDVISHQKDLNFKPGDQHVYCNTGYTLLAQIVKRVSGLTLRGFADQKIFTPLDMKSTFFRDDHAEIVKHLAYGYVEGAGPGGYRLSVTNFDTVGATSLLTTVEDLARWDENFYHPRVGGAAMVEQQLQRGKLNSGKELDYAFGLVHGKYRGLPTVDHGGADAGYRADLLRFPEQHFSVACLCNKGEINPSGLTRKVADIYLEKEFKEPAPDAAPPALKTENSSKPIAVSEQKLTQWPGLYWKSEDHRALRVLFEEGKLFISPSHDERYEMTAVSDNRYTLAIAPITLTFEDATTQSPQRMLLLSGDDDKPESFDRVTPFAPKLEQLSSFAGSYVSEEIDPVYRLVAEKGTLVLKRLKSKPETLEPTLEDHFTGLNGDIHFERDGNGKIVGFVLNAGRIKNFRFKKAASM